MRVEVLGAVSVLNDANEAITGQSLGGRRARVALVALALSAQPVTAERLASIIWGTEVPPTWQAALRGIVRGLRVALEQIGGGGQRVIVTTPSGYQLATDVRVDVRMAAETVAAAAALVVAGEYRMAGDQVHPVSSIGGDQLLPGEDAQWLEPHRQDLQVLAMRALSITVEAASRLGAHDLAIDGARRAVALDPLDERAHRLLIGTLTDSGDRAGAVLAYERCRSLLAEHLGVDPSPQTVEVFLAALGDQPGGSPVRWPIPGSSFVARERESAALDAALSRPGLVTVAGQGGVGKSRLAVQSASGRSDFLGGRFFVSLSSAAADELVAAGVATSLGVPIGTDDAAAAVASHLAPLGRALLVLDGCERVLDGVASLVIGLLSACPSVTIVVTSRVPLSVEGESILTVLPFTAPTGGDAAAVLADPLVRLLLDRVREGGGDLPIDDELAPQVASLLGRCGGLPLAVELVAAQLAAMPVGDLLDHLPEFFAGGEDELRAVARSSYALLDDDEAAVFRRFAVLDGPVGLALLRQVVSGGPIAPVRVVRILRELTARGLLVVDRSGPRWRYHQDDDLHRFARQLLTERAEERPAFDRLATAVRQVLPDDAREAPAPFQERINDMLGSVRSLFSAGVEGRADADRCLELAFRLHRYWATTNVAEGRFWLSRLLRQGPESRWTPYATYAAGYLDYWSGNTTDAVRELETAVRMLENASDEYLARALIYLAGLLDDLDRGTEAIAYVRRAIGAAAPFGIDLQVAAAMGLGSVLSERVAPEAAGYAADAIALCRAGGSAEQLAATLPTAAMVCWQVGAIEEARAYATEAMPMHGQTRRIARAVLLSAAAGIALADGDLDAAVDWATAADEEATALGVEREVPLIRSVLARALLARGESERAARHTAAAVEAASVMTVAFPLAVCLETAALVLNVTGNVSKAGIAQLLSSAEVIRADGDRPPPHPL